MLNIILTFTKGRRLHRVLIFIDKKILYVDTTWGNMPLENSFMSLFL